MLDHEKRHFKAAKVEKHINTSGELIKIDSNTSGVSSCIKRFSLNLVNVYVNLIKEGGQDHRISVIVAKSVSRLYLTITYHRP